MPVSADHSLSGKVALLIGATGAVGAVLARELAARGARLGIAVQRPWQVAKVSEVLGSSEVLVGVVATGDGEAAAGFHKGVHDSLGPVDAFLSTAGSFRASVAGGDPSSEAEELFAANVLASMTLARAVIGPMRRRHTGSLVFTGAAAVGGSGGAGMSNYLASKAALHEYARVLAEELAPDGIRVAVVTPGIVDTPGNREAMPEADRSGWHRIEDVVERLIDCAFGSPVGEGPLFPVAE